MIAQGRQHVPHPYGIVVFEDQLYYSDLTSMAIFKMSKYAQADDKTVLVSDNTKRMTTLHVIHPIMQQKRTCVSLKWITSVFFM